MKRTWLPILLFAVCMPPGAVAQGAPAHLRCTSEGSVELRASRDPASPVLARVQCGEAVLLIDRQFGSPHIRTASGADGYILDQNLDFWRVEIDVSRGPTQQPAPSGQQPVAPSVPTTSAPMQIGGDEFPRSEIFGGFSIASISSGISRESFRGTPKTIC